MTINRAITAQLVERFIFNFLVSPEILAERLPAPWIQPQIFDGWSVASFCILSLDHVIMAPLPGLLGRKTISCAYRCGVIDISDGEPKPSVYVAHRNTDLPLIAKLGPVLFADTMPVVGVAVKHERDGLVEIRVRHLDGRPMFAASVSDPGDSVSFSSEIFASLDAFSSFMRLGVSSYTPSIYDDELAKVDLHKKERPFEPLDTTVDFDSLETEWRDVGLQFDCAVRTTAGKYRWTYQGRRSASQLVPGQLVLK
jgi:hypothetical protein